MQKLELYLVTGCNYPHFTWGCALRGTLRTGFVALRFWPAEQNQQGQSSCASKLATQGQWGDDHGVSIRQRSKGQSAVAGAAYICYCVDTVIKAGEEPRQRESIRAQLKIHQNKRKPNAKDDILAERKEATQFL